MKKQIIITQASAIELLDVAVNITIYTRAAPATYRPSATLVWGQSANAPYPDMVYDITMAEDYALPGYRGVYLQAKIGYNPDQLDTYLGLALSGIVDELPVSATVTYSGAFRGTALFDRAATYQYVHVVRAMGNDLNILIQ